MPASPSGGARQLTLDSPTSAKRWPVRIQLLQLAITLAVVLTSTITGKQGIAGMASLSPDDEFATFAQTLPEMRNLNGTIRLLRLRPIYKGPYSFVYKGEHTPTGTLIAVKALNMIGEKSNFSMNRKLNREGRVMGWLSHTNILPLYGYANDHELFEPLGALITPWLANGDVSTYLSTRLYNQIERLGLFKDVIEGVHHLHTLNPMLVHGDIKPANILIDDRGHAVLCDFGLIRIYLEEGSSGFTTTSCHEGTERYLSPELVLAGAKAVPTCASDIYALGCVGLKLIFDHVPYAHHKETIGHVIANDIRAGIPPVDLSSLPRKLSSFVWLLSQCWDPDADARISIRQIMRRWPTLLPVSTRDESKAPTSIHSADRLIRHEQTSAPKHAESRMRSTSEVAPRFIPENRQELMTDAPCLGQPRISLASTSHGRLPHTDLQEMSQTLQNIQESLNALLATHRDNPAFQENLKVASTAIVRLQNLAPNDATNLMISAFDGLTPCSPTSNVASPADLLMLHEQGRYHFGKFERYGDLHDLEKAIARWQRAVNIAPASHPDKPRHLSSLGIALEARFNRHGSLGDLEESIMLQRKAVNLTADIHTGKPSYLSNLGNALKMRFNRDGSLVDLEEVIMLQRKAVDLTPDNHTDKSSCLGNLGNALETRFHRLGSLVDLEGAIMHQRMAVDLTPDGHPDRSTYLSNLGSALKTRFDRHGDLKDLEEAILRQKGAVKLTPYDHPDRAVYLNKLSLGIKKLFECIDDQDELQQALDAAQESAGSLVAPYKLRLRSALLWADCCAMKPTSSLLAFGCAIKLLPHMAWQGLDVEDQYALLAEAGSTARDAVAAAIAEEEYATAIEWAEQGRSIVWQNLLSLRTPLDTLRNQDPQLAMQLQSLSRQLEQPAETRNALEGSTLLYTSSNRIALALEREALIDKIRSMPGFESFLRPKYLEELAPAAKSGAIVIINIGKARCDALALLSDDNGAPHVVPIPLEHVTLQKTERLSQRLMYLLRNVGAGTKPLRKVVIEESMGDHDSVFEEVLQTLWLDYVKPIVDALAYSVNLDCPPRLWWCTTGPLAFLPLHAAGIYSTEEIGCKLSDYVVSSYTPTITSLLNCSMLSISPKILAVAMSETPGLAPTPRTEEEVVKVQRLAANLPTVTLRNGAATKEHFLKELEESSWVHIACHGQQTCGKPMESGLLLHDGKLKLSEIVKMHIPNADFAFLSACETAVGDGGVPEESVHLAAGMLFAGYRGVVATMWSIEDDIAPQVAEAFYRYMFRSGQPNCEEAAYALHRAVKSLRDLRVPFSSWIPFIHIGS